MTMLAVVPSLDNAKNCVTDLSFDHVLALARPVEAGHAQNAKIAQALSLDYWKIQFQT
jgi:hypothetical protein